MSEFMIYRGVPGSGKTTAALAWVAEDPESRVRVNRDDLRIQLYGIKVGLSQKQETQVTRAEKALVREFLNRGLSVVLDATNMHKRNLEAWGRIHPFELVEFDVPEDEIRRRNETRPEQDRLPVDALNRFLTRWYSKGRLKKLGQVSQPGFTMEQYDTSGMRWSEIVGSRIGTVICDLDGTLALHTSGRSPYDYSRVYEDSVNEAVWTTLDAFAGIGVDVVFVSGREDSCRDDTIRWLTDYCAINDPELYMRATGDKRDDTLVKYEIFDQHLRDRNIIAALDDRDRVVQMWRKIGVPCFQVNEGDF